jgi:uncharacterized protein (DUF885 family)
MQKPAIALFFSLIFMVTVSSAQNASAPESPPSSTQFDKLVDEYFDTYFSFNPSRGTENGFHQYDAQLEDVSRIAIDRQIAALKTLERRFDELSASASPQGAADLEIVRSDIKSHLLELETIRSWEKDPDIYSSGVASSIFTIMSRNFAPPEERLRSVIAREKQMPKVFEAARHNLKNPPRVYTEIALQQLPGIISFFQKDVPLAFAKVKDLQILAEFKTANQAVIQSLTKYENFLREDLLPISKGDFRIGAETYRKKLLYDEMVDIPLDRLLEIGKADLRHNQQLLKETAAKIDPKRTPQQIMDDLEKDHPAPNQLLQSFRDVLGGLVDFIQAHHIITIPSRVPPIVEETPPFDRALTFASMDTPGAYEKKAKEAYFNVTLPEPNWTRQHVEEHMSAFNRGTIISTAIHEVYPGHYTQFLWVQEAPTKVRKLIGVGSNAEGWAHYCEQMMLDEGYGKSAASKSKSGDKRFLQLGLGQIQDALLRDARYIVGLEMHTGKMSLEQGIDFFVKEGYQTRAVGDREAKRGTSDPTYLVYTLGKLQILKLRDDYKQLKGDKFNLQEFHNGFMRQGAVPIKVIRKAMLGNDSPVL